MKKSALYIRVSTSEQDPTMQLSDLRRYAQQGLSLQAIANCVKYKDGKGRWRNVSKGKVHRIIKKHGLTNLDVRKVPLCEDPETGQLGKLAISRKALVNSLFKSLPISLMLSCNLCNTIGGIGQKRC